MDAHPLSVFLIGITARVLGILVLGWIVGLLSGRILKSVVATLAVDARSIGRDCADPVPITAACSHYVWFFTGRLKDREFSNQRLLSR